MNQYTQINSDSLKQVSAFSQTLSDQQLSTEMPGGWTVSAVLVHLAFWDFRAMTLLKKWQLEGISPSPNDTDVINESTRPFLRAIEPERAVQLFTDHAHQMDEMIDSLDSAFLQEIEEKGSTVKLDRAHHRLLHLAEIKAALVK